MENIFQMHLFQGTFLISQELAHRGPVRQSSRLSPSAPRQDLQMFLFCFFLFLNNIVAVSAAPFWSGQHLSRIWSAKWYSPKPRGAVVSPDWRGLSHCPDQRPSPRAELGLICFISRQFQLWAHLELKREDHICWPIIKQCGLASICRVHSREFAIWSQVITFRSEYHTDTGQL